MTRSYIQEVGGRPEQVSKRVLTIAQFAKELGVTASCVRRWLLERKVSKVKLGKLVRIPVTEVDRLISEGLSPAIDVAPLDSVHPPLRPIIEAALKHETRGEADESCC